MWRHDVLRNVMVAVSLFATTGEALARAVIGTIGDGNFGIVVPTPGQGLPEPVASIVAGLPAGSRPHGVAVIDATRSLVADFNNFRLHVIDHVTAQRLDTIVTPNYNGSGTLAISPDGSVALASGFFWQLHVFRAPFSADSAQSFIQLPSFVPNFSTNGIVFDAGGRAYVRHALGISVVDPPYQAIAFEIPIDSLRPGAIAVTPDGSRLITNFTVAVDDGAAPASSPAAVGQEDSPTLMGAQLPRSTSATGAEQIATGLDVAALPLTPASVLQRVELLRCDCNFAAAVVTPDSQRALLALVRFDGGPLVYSLPAPFNDPATLENLPLPPGFASANGLEDIGVSANGSEAMLVGNSPALGVGLPALHVRAPFTAAGAQLSELILPGGRGAGSVRFVGGAPYFDAIFTHGFE